MDVEPAFTDFGEGCLDDLLKAANPALLTGIKLDLGDARGLNLFELLHSEGLAFHGDIVDAIILQELVAFGANVNHGPDNFFLDEE
jgi:hypothetical protein